MKNLFFALVFCICSVQIAKSQGSPYALGLRLGGGAGFGSEITYLHSKSDNNRYQFDLGLNSNNLISAFNLTGTYQWVKPLKGNFNWFYGPGVAIGSWGYRNGQTGLKDDGMFVSIVGIIGLEYIFPEIPLQVSLDARPSIPLIHGYNNYDFGALSIRYVF